MADFADRLAARSQNTYTSVACSIPRPCKYPYRCGAHEMRAGGLRGFHSPTREVQGSAELCCLVHHAVIDANGVRHVIAEALRTAAARKLQ